MNDCRFCDRLADGTESVIENDLCVFLQKEESVLIGSGLIVPRVHRETVFDLTADRMECLLRYDPPSKNFIGPNISARWI